MIDENVLKQILKTARIEDVIGEFVPLKKKVRTLSGYAHFMQGSTNQFRFFIQRESLNVLFVEREAMLYHFL